MSQGPPKDIPPSALWSALLTLPRPTKVVDYPKKLPGTDDPVGQFMIRVLTQAEQMSAAAEAEKFTQQLLKDKPKREDENLGYENVYKNACAVELLFRACRSTEEGNLPLFPSPTLMRSTLTGDEVGVLMSMYLETQVELGPIVSYMTDEEVDAWVVKLQEGGSTIPLALLSSEARNTLTMRLVSHRYNSLTATSSAGGPPDDSSQSNAPAPEVEGASAES